MGGVAIPNFSSARQKCVEKYASGSKAFQYNTRPYWSRFSVPFQVVDSFGGGTAAHCLVNKGQRLSAFDYQIGGTRPSGIGSSNIVATYSDTNLTAARKTNGTEDVVIEGIRLWVRGLRLAFAAPPAGVTNPAVVAAYAGLGQCYDIGAIVRGPQFDSPLRLSDSFPAFVRAAMSLTFQWDGEQTTKIGLAQHAPDNQSSQLLTSAGLPTAQNFLELPEGFWWRTVGSASDTELRVALDVEEDVVFLINATNPPGGTETVLPTSGAIDFVVETVGHTYKYPSKN